MSRSAFFLAGILLMSVGWIVVESCSCLPTHPQTQYCTADFVILAIPTAVTSDNFTKTYTIKILHNLKSSKNATFKAALASKTVLTGADSAQCGVELTLNKVYLLIGSVSNGKLHINLCSNNGLWSTVPHDLRRGYLDGYRRSCKCTVDTCFTSDCTKTATNCVYNTTHTNYLSCYSNYGYCHKNRDGNCDWLYTRHRGRREYSSLVRCLNTTAAYI